MTYDGRSQVGAPPLKRKIGHLQIVKIPVGMLDNNAYLISDLNTGTRALIDAAAEPAVILNAIPDRSLSTVITTHSHHDHWGALSDVVVATGATTAAGRIDAPAIGYPTAVPLDDGDHVSVGDIELEVIQVPGHTPGGIVLYLEAPNGSAHLFTGDSLFPGGVGRSTPETFGQLFDAVSTRIFDRFDDSAWIYPGHGWDTTLAVERPHLQEWRARGW